MKKILFTFVLVFSLMACVGRSASNNADAQDSVTVDSTMIDTISLDPGCAIDTIAD